MNQSRIVLSSLLPRVNTIEINAVKNILMQAFLKKQHKEDFR